ncbi:EVE domain-containing protein [Mucilaginibacter sp. JRF]|uniref:EVE domain-containing protein n=1 Tax=Mucilaginibacter sp. JRF TaxID=2780088 RepID=UPI0018809A89|nr:EVE domain-containing protein [Mucilaginibacter sp. JRF]MBE9586787.1 EVE domain-containing protein [Mucilaginibacter sp. JRF]
MATRYWVVVTSRDHALDGAKAGVVQVNHGKEGPLKRMSAGDKILFYAGKEIYGQKDLCQRFVALAVLADDNIFQYEVSANFKPYRRKAEYLEGNEAEIRPLINRLEFIENKEKWGYIFRTGLFEIHKHDFDLIESQMHDK